MADKDTKETRDDGDDAKAPNGNELKMPDAGGSLRPAMAHRTDHGPLTKAE